MGGAARHAPAGRGRRPVDAPGSMPSRCYTSSAAAAPRTFVTATSWEDPACSRCGDGTAAEAEAGDPRLRAAGQDNGHLRASPRGVTHHVHVPHEAILAELKLNLSDLIDPNNAQRLGRVYGVDAIASGFVTELATTVEVNARLIETETGRVFSVAKTRFAKDRDVAILIGGSPAAATPGSGAVPPPPPGEPVAGMALIPAGQFIYGPEAKEQRISLPAFSMDVYEVTNAEYAKVRPHEYPADKANHPVVNVSWYDAKRYCEAVAKRLPTEQEWEKAARGTDGRHYPWGDTWDPKRANSDNRFGGTTPVGQFPAGKSPYGLLDMAGNVWEWTASEQGGNKDLRGGSWYGNAIHLRTANRDDYSPDLRDGNGGFRCARGAP